MKASGNPLQDVSQIELERDLVVHGKGSEKANIVDPSVALVKQLAADLPSRNAGSLRDQAGATHDVPLKGRNLKEVKAIMLETLEYRRSGQGSGLGLSPKNGKLGVPSNMDIDQWKVLQSQDMNGVAGLIGKAGGPGMPDADVLHLNPHEWAEALAKETGVILIFFVI